MQTEAAGGIHMNLIGQAGGSEKKHAQVLGLSSMEQGFANLRYQGTLSANWLLTDFGKTKALLRSALTLHEAGLALEHRKQQEIVFAVSLQFLKTMTLRDLLEATSGTRDSLQAFAQSIGSQIAKGRAPEVDALKINIRLAEVESQLAELERNLQVSRAALSRLMGVEEALPALATSPMADIEAPKPKPEAPGIPDMKNRLDIKAQELMVQAGQERILASEREFLPRVEFFANAGLYGATDPETGTGLKDDDPWKNDVSGGIRITLPLLDNGLRRSNLAISRAKFKKNQATLRAKQLAARQEIIVARASVTSARVKIKVTQKTIIHARKVVQIEQLKYQIGRGTSAEVLEAETALLNAKSLFRQANRELSIALLAEGLALGI